MLKTGRTWLCILIVAAGLALGWSTPTLADDQTQTGITFVGGASGGNPSKTDSSSSSDTTGSGDQDDSGKPIIPDGQKPIIKDVTGGVSGDNGVKGDQLFRGGDAANKANNAGKTKQPSVKKVVRDVAHALISGRLPQTNESQTILLDLIGIFLLIVLVLSAIIYRQVKLSRGGVNENE